MTDGGAPNWIDARPEEKLLFYWPECAHREFGDD
jgi:hypothetical protein